MLGAGGRNEPFAAKPEKNPGLLVHTAGPRCDGRTDWQGAARSILRPCEPANGLAHFSFCNIDPQFSSWGLSVKLCSASKITWA